MNFRPCPRLDNANVSYSFQDWQSFILFSFFFFGSLITHCDSSTLFLLGLLFTVYCVKSFSKSLVISSSYSIQSRLKPGVTQGMLIFLFLFSLLSFFHFALAFSSYPGPEICVRSSSELEFESFKLFFLIVIVIYDCFFVDLVAWLFVGFFWFWWKLGVY